MYVAALWPVALALLATFASAKPRARKIARRASSDPKYVKIQDGKFTLNGAPFNFIGTNAYWLPTLDDGDIDKTLSDIAAAGIKVVRTWAFNDVTKIPDNGTWFQLITDDGQFKINEGANGLKKLDTVVKLAEKHGIHLLLSLTNNWSLDPADEKKTPAGVDPKTLLRNTLSNDYGGMDVYIRQLGGPKHHERFYTNNTFVNAFKDYTTVITKRYCKSPSILAWEIANDPRCNSTLPAQSCNPQDVTKWHAEIAEHIKTVDTNHLVSSGAGGFLCAECPKVFPLTPPTTPPPAVSPVPGQRRSVVPTYITRSQIIQERAAIRKRTRALYKRSGSGPQIRGRWKASVTRRQDQGVGPAFDGSYGVDAEDIMNSGVSFGSFQLFPDQVNYAPDDPNLSAYQNKVNAGLEWINAQARLGQIFNKPTTLTGFGLVTQSNVPSFAPFDASTGSSTAVSSQSIGVTDAERDAAYQKWLTAGLAGGLTNMIQYQWGQDGLTASPGTPVSSVAPGPGIGDIPAGTGISPNDGYSTNGQGKGDVVGVLTQASQNFARDT